MNYTENLFCWSMAMSDKQNIYEDGDKIILPSSVLGKVTLPDDGIPLYFKLGNPTLNLSTHVGVLEFSATEGNCNIPHWIMAQLVLREGEIVNVELVDALPPAEFIKLRPQYPDLLDSMCDPQAILGVKLRKYTCLTQGQWICVPYMGDNVYFDVVETRPTWTVSLIDIEATLEFEIPKQPALRKPEPLPKMDTQKSSDKSGVSRNKLSRVSRFKKRGTLDQFPGSGRKL
jgi:ubiquitin fusion degradation protein 1